MKHHGNTEAQTLALGVVRLEISFLTTQGVNALKNKLNLPNREPQYILQRNIADFVIGEAMQRLNFQALPETAGEQNNVGKLIKIYGVKKARNLIGFITLFEVFGQDFYKLPMPNNMSRPAYFSDLKLCRQADVFSKE